MEIGGFFILVILLIVLIVLGTFLYGVAAWLRHRKLHPERDKLDEQPRGERPRHVRHGRSQRARFLGSR